MTALATVSQARLLKRQAALRDSLEKGCAAEREARAQELAETEAALARIDHGSYGRCDGCGGAIGRQRLLALPEARLCIPCTENARGLR